MRTSSELWRRRGIGVVRIAFGVIWFFDARFKWAPQFSGHFADYLNDAAKGQPPLVTWYIRLWLHLVSANPAAFAHAVAVAETAVAVGLIFGVFSNLTNVGGALLAFAIWSTAEGFGGPYAPGATDIGAAIVYVVAFAALFFANAGRSLAIDPWLTPRLRAFAFLASPL